MNTEKIPLAVFALKTNHDQGPVFYFGVAHGSDVSGVEIKEECLKSSDGLDGYDVTSQRSDSKDILDSFFNGDVEFLNAIFGSLVAGVYEILRLDPTSNKFTKIGFVVIKKAGGQITFFSTEGEANTFYNQVMGSNLAEPNATELDATDEIGGSNLEVPLMGAEQISKHRAAATIIQNQPAVDLPKKDR